MRLHLPWPTRARGKSYLARVVLFLLILWLGVTATTLALEDRLVFHPVPAATRWLEPPSEVKFEDLYFSIQTDVVVHARWFPCPGASSAVLVCHSRAGNLSIAVRPHEVAEWHHETGRSVLVFDYPGYGRSGGKPTEAGCYQAAATAYQWLTETQGVAAEQVLLYGRSLGTAVAVELAVRFSHEALVLISPFTSLPDVSQDLYPVLPARLLMRNRFDSRSRIASCTRPLLIVHGTEDGLVSCKFGEQLFAAANEPKQLRLVAGATHGNSVLVGFYPFLRRFLSEADNSSNREAPRLPEAGVPLPHRATAAD